MDLEDNLLVVWRRAGKRRRMGKEAKEQIQEIFKSLLKWEWLGGFKPKHAGPAEMGGRPGSAAWEGDKGFSQAKVVQDTEQLSKCYLSLEFRENNPG